MRSSASGLFIVPFVLLTLASAPVLAQKGAAKLPTVSGEARAEAMSQEVLNQLRVAQDRHWHKGEYCHIVALARMIVAGDPHDVETFSNAGWLLWSMDKDNDAIAIYKQGIAANPNTYYMYDELGQYYYNRKRDAANAAIYLQKAVAMPDCKARALHTLAHSYERLGDLARARDTWSRAVEMADNPTRPAAKVNLDRVTHLIAQKSSK